MNIVKKIKMGSTVFFEKYDDFKSKDTDWLCLVEDFIGKDKAMRVQIKDDDIVMYRNDYSKEEFLNEALNSNIPMKIGKFLVPEFIELYDVTIDDLKKLNVLVEGLDEKHLYEKIIYDSYIENNKLELTEEQNLLAYNEYRKTRNEQPK